MANKETTAVVSREGLLKAIQKARMAVSRKATIPIIGAIHMQASHGVLTVTGTNLEEAIRFKVPCTGALDPVAVPPGQIAECVKALTKRAEVKLATDGSNLHVTSGSFKATVAGFAADSYPDLPQTPELTYLLPDLKNMAFKVAPAISQEESRFTLNAARLQVRDNVLSLSATDGHRAHVASVGFIMEPFRTLIPVRVLSWLGSMGSVGMSISAALDDGQFAAVHDFAGNDEMTVIWRKYSSTKKFADIDRVIQPRLHSCVIGTPALRQALLSVRPFTDERSRSARFTFSRGMLTITSSTFYGDSCSQSVACEYLGDSMLLGLKVDYLMDVTKAAGQDALTIGLNDEKSAVNFNAPGFVAAVMPLRL